MQTIEVTYKDGVKVTYTGSDLSAYWEAVSNDPKASYGDYYVPGKNKPRLAAYFGSIETTLPV